MANVFQSFSTTLHLCYHLSIQYVCVCVVCMLCVCCVYVYVWYVCGVCMCGYVMCVAMYVLLHVVCV